MCKKMQRLYGRPKNILGQAKKPELSCTSHFSMSDDLMSLIALPWFERVPVRTLCPRRPQPKQHTPAFKAAIAMPYNATPRGSRQAVVSVCDAVDLPSGVNRRTHFGTLDALAAATRDPDCVVLHVHAHTDAAGNLFLEDKCGAAHPLRPAALLRVLNAPKWREVCAEGEDVPLPLQLAVFAGWGTEALFAAGASRVPHIVAHKVDAVRDAHVVRFRLTRALTALLVFVAGV